MNEENKFETVEEDTTAVESEKRKDHDFEKSNKKDALVTCRVLFISVLDKIYLICLALSLAISTYGNFAGDMSSVSYGFWGRVGKEIITLIILVIIYFIYNWFYKCFAKTMLCVTEKEIYREKYLPFVRTETTIPLNRITGITAHKYLWIFRAVMIHQYHRFPIIFFTWNNQEFKDKVEELLTNDSTKVNNQFESKNIINKGQYKYVAIAGGILVAIIAFLGIIRFFSYMFSDERSIPGVYSYKENLIDLSKDGTCTLKMKGIDDVTSCNWVYDSDSKKVNVDYKYTYKYSSYFSSYSYEREMAGSIAFEYSNKTLTYNDNEYKKN